MAYNADGLRVEKEDSDGTSKFVWDGQNVLMETDTDGVTQADYSSQPAGYGDLISQRRSGTSRFFVSHQRRKESARSGVGRAK